MVFSSYTFIFGMFLPLLAVYFLIPQRLRQGRNLVLLVFSLVFYGCGGVGMLPVMGASILINYLGGLLISNKRLKKQMLILSITANLLLLGWFKYAGFLTAAINTLGIPVPIPDVVLPIGISFFTFQGLSYVVDVYRGDTTCQRNLLKLALYISLFPQLIAGPIVRYNDVAAEIDSDRESLANFSDGLVRFCFGLSKKVLLANVFGEIADVVFDASPAILSVGAAWVGAIAYTLQIYFDFSGYSDMAIGLGRIFGFHFTENFNYPYISRSITEFWTRWHISLSSWFRDYVYIPLGGSRTARWKHVRNILIVWILTGLWHGADWNFVFWGAWYGLFLLGEKFIWPRFVQGEASIGRWLFTMTIVVIGWVFFRAKSLSAALVFLKAMFGGSARGGGQGLYYIMEYWPEWVTGIIACLPVKNWLEMRFSNHHPIRIWMPKLAALILFGLSYMKLVTGSFNPFLYYRF